MRKIFAALLLMAGAASALPAQGEKKPAEWTDLVAGDLAKHWTTKGNWTLDKDGVISLTPRPGEKGWSRFDAYLWSKVATYGNFECAFEYKVEKAGNGGFYFHVGDTANPVNKGIEVQIFDAPEKPDEKLTDHHSGGVIPGIPPTKHAAKPTGEWNAMLVTVQGDKLTVVLNGVTVNDVNLGEGKLKDRPKSGSVGFQDHGLPLALRNIKVREIQ